MIELRNDELLFSFPEVHPAASFKLNFQRTLRIPDDDKEYPLPPGLGSFPLRHVDDFAPKVPQSWLARGGIMLPMYQSEALWLRFSGNFIWDRETSYPLAVKVATGKIDAVSGKEWSSGLHRNPQDYLVVPEQPWLDGYCVKKGVIRQFVAMPLGSGYSAEEQITGKAEHGGLQLLVCPMKRDVFERRFPKVQRQLARAHRSEKLACGAMPSAQSCVSPMMGLAPGGQMKQEIYDDPFDLSDWDTEHTSRCFVHIANSLVWNSIVGQDPPHPPPTSTEYTRAGLPWFDYYNEKANAVEGSSILQKLKSVLTVGKEKGDVPLPENEPVTPEKIVTYHVGLKPGQVREGTW